ncbi:hypothetical protein PF327_10200 [Sulfurovum sp. XTW-4]|uniref:Helix-turn-helix domain-containing protein n=1 Tax=Sulfurovum xiamenensis TaxID=3019066 RepID=A0ABT7QU22_9BACT|nr:replication protein [Sulfurovum xiamenensis]MDM5264564.1 hypothetical protein [Sulfurovum xiamenensis]
MSKLSVTYHGEKYELDEFYKSLLFQRIMDGDFNRDERDVLLVIFRKTLHFDKWYDRLGIYWLSKAVGIGQNKLRQTLKQLEAKGLLEVEHSKGGRTNGNQKFSQFSLANDFIFLIVDKWLDIKMDNDFKSSYE